jgi:tetratricopeptide (TPR) repeat protein
MVEEKGAVDLLGFAKDVLPKIKTRIQLSGLIVTLVVVFLIRAFAPENTPAQICGGMIGICIIIFTLVFNFLSEFPEGDRARVVLTLFIVFSVTIVTLVALTGYFLLMDSSRAYSALYDTAKKQLEEKEDALNADLKKLAERKIREQAVLTFADWKEITTSEELTRAQLLAIEDRKMHMENIKTRAKAVVDEINLLASSGEPGNNAEVRKQASDAQSAFSQGDLNKAGVLFQGLARAGQEQTADANFWLGRLSELQANYPEARSYYRVAHERAPDKLRYVEDLAKIEEELGSLKSAQSLYETLVAEYRTKPDHRVNLVMALKDLGNVTRFLDGTQAALQYYAEAFAIAKSLQDDDKVQFALVANDFGAFYAALGSFSKAEELYDASLDIYRSRKDKYAFGYADVLNNLGFLYAVRGDYRKAELFLKEAIQLEADTSGTNVPLFAVSTGNLAYTYAESGKFSDSEERYQTALAVAERTLGKSHSRYGRLLGVHAEMLMSTRKYDLASSELELSYQILTGALGPGHSFVGITHLRMAELLCRQGLSLSALPHLQAADEILKKTVSMNRLLMGRLARLWGDYMILTGDNAQAISFFSSALEDQKQALGPNHAEIARTLMGYGDALRLTGDRGNAEGAYSEARSIASKALSPGHPLIAALNAKRTGT